MAAQAHHTSADSALCWCLVTLVATLSLLRLRGGGVMNRLWHNFSFMVL